MSRTSGNVGWPSRQVRLRPLGRCRSRPLGLGRCGPYSGLRSGGPISCQVVWVGNLVIVVRI